MTKRDRDKVFCIIYNNVSKKHPDWSPARINAATIWCLKKSMKPKTIKGCNNG